MRDTLYSKLDFDPKTGIAKARAVGIFLVKSDEGNLDYRLAELKTDDMDPENKLGRFLGREWASRRLPEDYQQNFDESIHNGCSNKNMNFENVGRGQLIGYRYVNLNHSFSWEAGHPDNRYLVGDDQGRVILGKNTNVIPDKKFIDADKTYEHLALRLVKGLDEATIAFGIPVYPGQTLIKASDGKVYAEADLGTGELIFDEFKKPTKRWLVFGKPKIPAAIPPKDAFPL